MTFLYTNGRKPLLCRYLLRIYMFHVSLEVIISDEVSKGGINYLLGIKKSIESRYGHQCNKKEDILEGGFKDTSHYYSR